MPKEQSAGKPTTRRYSPEEKAAAVRMVRALRASSAPSRAPFLGSLTSSATGRVGALLCARPTSTTVRTRSNDSRSRTKSKNLVGRSGTQACQRDPGNERRVSSRGGLDRQHKK